MFERNPSHTKSLHPIQVQKSQANFPKIKRLSETMTNKRRYSGGQALKKRQQPDLPNELWEQILSKLSLKDNICASAVSKRFLSIATLVQKTDKPPLLVIAPKSGDLYEFFNPFDHKSYCLDLPELRGARFLYSKDGWLLMSNFESESLFLYHSNTRELIQLPVIPSGLKRKLFALSTSPSCMVFVVDQYAIGVFGISKCRPGDIEWTNVIYETMIPPHHVIWDNLVFHKGLLYCFDIRNLIVYNPKGSSWTDYYMQYEDPERFFFDNWVMQKFVVEYNGDIIQVFILLDRSLVILKLDLPNRMWVEIETLTGGALFLDYSSSHVRNGVLGNKRGHVYLAEAAFRENSCILYSIEDGKFCPKNKSYSWTDQTDQVRESIWIDAPEDLSY